MLARLGAWYSNAQVLQMATFGNAQLLAMSGPRSPYTVALGVLEPGAAADLLMFEEDPLEDLSVLAEPETQIRLIMKDGVVHKHGRQEPTSIDTQ